MACRYAYLHVMSFKTTMFQEIPFNSFRGQLLTKNNTDGLSDWSKTSFPPQLRCVGYMNFNIRAIWQIWPWRLFLAHLAVSRMSFCHHFASVVRPSVRPSSVRRKLFIQRSSPLKLLDQLKPNLVTMVLGWSPLQNSVQQVRIQSKIYRLNCEFYILKCKFYRLKCKFYRLKCKIYRLKCEK